MHCAKRVKAKDVHARREGAILRYSTGLLSSHRKTQKHEMGEKVTIPTTQRCDPRPRPWLRRKIQIPACGVDPSRAWLGWTHYLLYLPQAKPVRGRADESQLTGKQTPSPLILISKAHFQPLTPLDRGSRSPCPFSWPLDLGPRAKAVRAANHDSQAHTASAMGCLCLGAWSTPRFRGHGSPRRIAAIL
jgi:hypothetical protein